MRCSSSCPVADRGSPAGTLLFRAHGPAVTSCSRPTRQAQPCTAAARCEHVQVSEQAAEAKAERTLRAAALARNWGCIVGLVGIAVALVGAFLLEGGAGTALVSLGGSAFGVGLLFAVYGVLAKWLLPSRS